MSSAAAVFTLKSILSDITADAFVRNSICSEFSYRHVYAYNQPHFSICEGIKAWPLHSKDLVYPVPHPTLDPEDAFWSSSDLYSGIYGANRIALLVHLINYYENQES